MKAPKMSVSSSHESGNHDRSAVCDSGAAGSVELWHPLNQFSCGFRSSKAIINNPKTHDLYTNI